MASITLPDGSVRELPDGSTVAQLAESIGKGLAKAALVGKVDGKLVDLSFPLTGAQINELESGLWYANVTSAKQPDGQLRGQILLVTTLTSFAYTNNQFQFSVRRAPTYSYIIQASTNLTSWTSLQTNTSPFTFTDALATNYPYRFYRVIH